MAEALKEIYNRAFLKQLAQVLQNAHSECDPNAFVSSFQPGDWKKLELMQRVEAISDRLNEFLPPEYITAVQILVNASCEFSRYVYIIFPDFVAMFGLNDYKTSFRAFEQLTCYSTSEFAIRNCLEKDPDRTMKQMLKWSRHKNEHVRRLASEGCRPRLPWASALNEFKKDPSPILPILENLKQDKSEYVRRSVANNLNDISKDHPNLVIDLAKSWAGQHPFTDRLLKHGCRTLLKSGETKVLSLFGYPEPKHIQIENFKADSVVKMHDDFEFSFTIQSKKTKPLGQVRIEYELEFVRQGNKYSRKLFKLADNYFEESEKGFNKRFSFKPLSTRKYFPGKHQLRILVNGKTLYINNFMLT